jgi:uncharacterized membrane protein
MVPLPLMIHICSAVVALIAGFLAVLLRKGTDRHRLAGNIFTLSMISMSVSAVYVAMFLRLNRLNAVMGVFAFYLVTTAWKAGRNRDGNAGRFERAAMVLVLLDAFVALSFAVQAANTPDGTLDHFRAPGYFIFGSVILLFGVADIRMVRRGGAFGPKRIARHLWRMCFALLIAVLSFYPGQAKLFSAAFRQSSLPYVPHILLVGSMAYWMVRTLRARRVKGAVST